MFGKVASHGVSLLPISEIAELSVRATTVPSNTKEIVGTSSRGTPAPYVVVSHHCVPFLLFSGVGRYFSMGMLTLSQRL